MNVVDLSRFQFGMTTIFHFFFVPFSIGTALVVSIMETLYVVKKDEKYKKMAQFWGKIFLLSFAVGVVTGIIQEFQFGMNWSEYSRFVGDTFGVPLAIEALLAFFMESTFLGLWMFTWKKVKKGLHLTFMWLTTIGSILSAFWILTANAFMQHPTGYKVVGGHAQMISFKALVMNPQVWFEFLHVMAAAILMGGVIIAGLSAFQGLKKAVKDCEFYRSSMRIGFWVALIGSIGTLAVGDLQTRYLIHEQPMKFAATEGVYETTKSPAPWAVLGWANEKEHKEEFSIDIPYMLSILSYHKLSGSVQGMNETNKELQAKYGKENDYYLPTNLLFYSFRIMCGIAGLILLVSIVGLFFTRRKKGSIFKHRWMLWIVGLCTFVPFIGNTVGWLITEEGRYPWTVYGLFTIKDSVSPTATVGSLLTSNIVYFVVFACLSAVMVYLVVKTLNQGPDDSSNDDSEIDPFDKEVLQG